MIDIVVVLDDLHYIIDFFWGIRIIKHVILYDLFHKGLLGHLFQDCLLARNALYLFDKSHLLDHILSTVYRMHIIPHLIEQHLELLLVDLISLGSLHQVVDVVHLFCHLSLVI